MRDHAAREPVRKRSTDARGAREGSPVLGLQRAIGNRATRSVLSRTPVEEDTQRKEATVEIDGLGTITMLSWSFDAGGTGKLRRDIFITSRMGALSPELAQAAARGKHFDTATLISGPAKITLKDVVIASYQTSTSDGDPIDSWSISYSSIEMSSPSVGSEHDQ
jgi:type VI secretion system (T6SS) effector Hcp